MRTFDLTPLFRSSIGYESLVRIVDAAMRGEEGTASYPPYNIEKLNDHTYRLVMAVAGFSEDELSASVQNNTLVVAGKAKMEEENVQYLYKGIARRAFERHFQLADFIKIGDALLENGLLKIVLVREMPQTIKPRTIEIHTKSGSIIDAKKSDK
jgi:molecular chaperone IbpA